MFEYFGTRFGLVHCLGPIRVSARLCSGEKLCIVNKLLTLLMIRSLQKFRKIRGTKDPEWTLKHAFLAAMGGFKLLSPDCDPIPSDSERLFYLVDHKDVEWPEVSADDIDDKNKADGLAR